MIVYFDTSALVKRYVAEAGSDAILALWAETTRPASSWLLYAETVAAFARKRREQPEAAMDEPRGLFDEDWQRFYRIPIDNDVNRRVNDLLATRSLRGADAVHLASALLLRDLAGEEVTFACADAALADAARAEGLTVVP